MAKEINEFTGAKIALHEDEKDWLEKSTIKHPPGVTAWGRTFASRMTLCNLAIHVSPTEVDMRLRDGKLSLESFRIPGKILHTQGH